MTLVLSRASVRPCRRARHDDADACEIIDVTAKKRVELKVYTPLRKNPYPPSGFTGERLVKELGGLIQRHRTTLVFCNTRSGAEATTFWLRERFPELAEAIECHHASLERDVRRGVEDRLKRGELRAVVCSTSLELGIDIGSVDLVVMLATPKGVSRALQRAGRAGHDAVFPFDRLVGHDLFHRRRDGGQCGSALRNRVRSQWDLLDRREKLGEACFELRVIRHRNVRHVNAFLDDFTLWRRRYPGRHLPCVSRSY